VFLKSPTKRTRSKNYIARSSNCVLEICFIRVDILVSFKSSSLYTLIVKSVPFSFSF